MNKKLKIGMVLGNIVICLMIQSISALAWMDTQVINDYSNDMVSFDEEFYEKYEIDTESNTEKDLDTLHEAITKHWFSAKSTVLTPKKQEKYEYVDILDISKEVVSEELVIKVRTSGNIEKEEYWICFLWNNEMTLMFTCFGDTIRLYDLENEENYVGKFYDTDEQFISRFENVDEDAWKGSDIKFISIGLNSDNDIIVDISPNPINYNMVYISFGIIALVIILFALVVYYKNKKF